MSLVLYRILNVYILVLPNILMEEVKEILQLLNHWWKTGKVDETLAKPYKREMFNEIEKLLDYRQIVILSGLRRVGKTTILYQTIEHLLKENKPEYILYFNFDKKVEKLIDVLKHYKDLTRVDWEKESVFVFLDEIVKLKDWAAEIKLLYDAFPKLRFFISSSSSIGLEEEAIKTLGGRYFLKNVKPLSFPEYLKLKGKGDYLKKINLFEDELEKEHKNYLLRSFPETVEWEDELAIKDYLRSTIIDKIVKTDLPEKFEQVNKELLFRLLEIFYSEPGIYLDYDSLSKNLRISKNTLSSHIYYLEFAYLIRKVKNFRIGALVSSRKLQRIYPYWWTLTYCYTENSDKIFETIIASTLNAKYYWKKNGKEIDFLDVDKKEIIPYEAKNKNILSTTDPKTMKYLLEKYKIKEGFIIYNGKEHQQSVEGKTIKYIPLWKWLLVK